MSGYIFTDPNYCPTNTYIASIVLSESGPWGLDPITKVLTIPNSATRLRGQPVWTYDTASGVMELTFTQFNGTTNQFPAFASPTGTLAERSNALENNGIGIEFIWSDLDGASLSANPSAMTNAQGAAGRKYQDHQYYVWVDMNVSRPTHWWCPVSQAWWRIRPLRNTLTVGPDSSFDFQTLNAAFAYINGLPTSPNVNDPNQDAKQSATNMWTVILWRQTTITARLEMLDFVNVMFMPGAQIIDSPTSHPGTVMLSMSTTDPVRSTTLGTGGLKFRALWSSLSPYFGNSSDRTLYNIVHGPGVAGGDVSAILISGMQSASLSNLSIYLTLNSLSVTSCTGVRVGGAILEAQNLARQGVHLNRINCCSEPSEITGGATTCFWFEQTSGACYMSDCQAIFTSKIPTNGRSRAIVFWGTGTSTLEIDECRVETPAYGTPTIDPSGLLVINGATGTVFVSRSDFEGFGSTSDGSKARCMDLRGGNTVVALSKIVITQSTTTTSADPSTPVLYDATTGTSMIVDGCVLLAPAANADGIRLLGVTNALSAEAKVNQCVIVGGRGSVFTSASLTNANFYGNHLDGVINGTFTANAATQTFNTTYRV